MKGNNFLRIQRPVLSYPLPRTHAVKPSIAGEPGVNNYLLRDLNEVMSTRIASEANSLVMAKTSKDIFAHVPDSATSSSERSVSTIVKPPPARPSQFRPSSLDIFQASIGEIVI